MRISLIVVLCLFVSGCLTTSNQYSYKLKKPDSPPFEGKVYAEDGTDAGLKIYNATGYLPYEIKEVD